MNINLTSIYLLFFLLSIVLPLLVVAWGMFKHKSAKTILLTALIGSAICGGVIQTSDPGNTHVPFSEYMLLLSTMIYTMFIVTTALLIRFIVRKIKHEI